MSDKLTKEESAQIEGERSLYWRSIAEKLERENAALLKDVCDLVHKNELLREDKERLDWMASADYWADIAVYRTPKGLRAAIDAARKEAQP